MPASACTGLAACGRPERKAGEMGQNLHLTFWSHGFRFAVSRRLSKEASFCATSVFQESAPCGVDALMAMFQRSTRCCAKARKRHRLFNRRSVCSQCRHRQRMRDALQLGILASHKKARKQRRP